MAFGQEKNVLFRKHGVQNSSQIRYLLLMEKFRLTLWCSGRANYDFHTKLIIRLIFYEENSNSCLVFKSVNERLSRGQLLNDIGVAVFVS